MDISPKLLLSKLVEKGKLTQEEADHYEVASLQKSISIDQYLFEKSNIDKTEIIKAVADIQNIPYADLSSSPIDSEAVGFIPETIARKYHLIPYHFDAAEGIVYLGTADPYNISIIDFLEKKTGKKIVLALANQDQVEKMINLAYSQGLSPEVREALKEYIPDSGGKKIDLGTAINEAPIAKIVSTILEFSIKSRASDIHIEPEETRTKVRYRVDGILQEKLSLPKTIHDALISRIKILSEMKIDEKRIPQDGRFTFKIGDEEVDLRVSTLPTVNGEKVVEVRV